MIIFTNTIGGMITVHTKIAGTANPSRLARVSSATAGLVITFRKAQIIIAIAVPGSTLIPNT